MPTAGFLLENLMDRGAWRAMSTVHLRLDEVPEGGGGRGGQRRSSCIKEKNPGTQMGTAEVQKLPPTNRETRSVPSKKRGCGLGHGGPSAGLGESGASEDHGALHTEFHAEKPEVTEPGLPGTLVPSLPTLRLSFPFFLIPQPEPEHRRAPVRARLLPDPPAGGALWQRRRRAGAGPAQRRGREAEPRAGL